MEREVHAYIWFCLNLSSSPSGGGGGSSGGGGGAAHVSNLTDSWAFAVHMNAEQVSFSALLSNYPKHLYTPNAYIMLKEDNPKKKKNNPQLYKPQDRNI